jgi:hypothetical protein
MSHRTTTRRVLTALLAGFLLLFAFQVATHAHSNSVGDDHCQLCHFSHSVSLGTSATPVFVAPTMVARLVRPVSTDPKVELQFRQLSSRAPPAQA